MPTQSSNPIVPATMIPIVFTEEEQRAIDEIQEILANQYHKDVTPGTAHHQKRGVGAQLTMEHINTDVDRHQKRIIAESLNNAMESMGQNTYTRLLVRFRFDALLLIRVEDYEVWL